MNKNIWIINHYGTSMMVNKGGRHYWIAKYLKKNGYEPVVFACNTKHGAKEKWFDTNALWTEHIAEEINTPFVIVNAPTYEGNGKDRVLNMLSFYRNVMKTAREYSIINGKPDVILASSVHPLTLLAGIRLARRFSIKCISEIRDLWPESLVAYGMLKKDSIVVVLLRALEKWLYCKSDKLIFTMEGAYEYIKDQHWDNIIPKSKVVFINNGIDQESFNNNVIHNTINDPELEDAASFKIVYTGSLRKANNIGKLLDAAKLIDNEKVRFLIWGSGDELDELKERISKEKIKNVSYKGNVNKEFVPYILTNSNANFLDPFDDAVAKYGISSNKLFEYFAAGKPIIMSDMHSYIPGGESECKFYYSDDPQSIVDAINAIEEMNKEQYSSLCYKAKEIAKQYSFDKLTKELIEVIEE